MEAFDVYSRAIASVVIFTIIILVISPFSAVLKMNKGLAPGATPEQDYSDLAYRLNRAYLNCTETLPAFVAVVGAAMLLGVSPYWVNLLASIALVARVILLVVHVAGIGKPNMSLRTFSYVGGWLPMLIIGVMALGAAF